MAKNPTDQEKEAAEIVKKIKNLRLGKRGAANCKLEVWAGEPMCCPINGEECDWCPEKANK